MISDEMLGEIAAAPFGVTVQEVEELAERLMKNTPCHHEWNALKLVESGGTYLCCSLCGAKKAAA